MSRRMLPPKRSLPAVPGCITSRLPGFSLLLCWAGLVVGCQAASPGAQPPTLAPPGAAPTASRVRPAPLDSAQPALAAAIATHAPQPARAHDPVLDPLLDLCGEGDRALHQAAQRLLDPTLERLPLDAGAVTFALRTAGSPYVRPRGLRLRQPEFDGRALRRGLVGWLETLEAGTTRRCGVAGLNDSERGYQLSVVVAEAIAELEPVASYVPAGHRVRFRARVSVPATAAELILLAPAGRPRPIAARLVGDQVSADFYVDRTGTHRLQLMVDHDGGPRPALEAWIGVGRRLPAKPHAERVPGQDSARAGQSPADALTAMLNAARRSEGIPALERSRELDRVADDHARAMRRAGRMAHDLGDGSPLWRAETARLSPRTMGENLAHAPSLRQAHRAIWLSPSHRANVLARHFDRIGIGIDQDESGDWWICQLFADQE